METENKILLYKNLKNFEIIVDCFFEKKHLYYWNFYPEYCNFAEKLEKNFEELKKIITEKNLKEFFDYVNALEIATSKNKFGELYKINILLKNIHYRNILEYLNWERKNKTKPKFEIIYKNFFNCSEELVYEHFELKHRIYHETEEKYFKDNLRENTIQIIDITKKSLRMESKHIYLLQKNLENFDLIIKSFFEKKELEISNYAPEFKKCVKKLKKNLKNLKNLLKIKEKKEIISIDIQLSIKKLENEGTKYLDDCKYLIKKRHYNNILKYLEMEKSNTRIPKFEEIYEDFLGYVYDIVFDYFYMKKKIERQAEESE